MSGVVFVGAGPGDPGLVPVRGQRALGEAAVVIYDVGVPSAVLELAPEEAERLPVGAGVGVAPADAAAVLVQRARGGRRVVRLLAEAGLGFGEEAGALAAAGIAFEVVPGVSPGVAAAACAGIPLLPPGHAGPVLELVGRDVDRLPWGSLAGAAETVVGRVSEAGLPRAVAQLLAGGRAAETPAALVAGGSTGRQRTLAAPLGALGGEARRAGFPFPALLLVGPGVAWQARLAWFERRPLFGRRIVVTRPRHQAPRLAALLEAAGAEVLALPAIRLEPPEDWGPLDRAIARLPAFRWVVFTSANGVAAFRERLGAAGLDARALAGARLAAIGPETAESLATAGLRADVVPAEYRAEALAAALGPQVGPGVEVLLVRAAAARDVLPRQLEARGARVTVAPAYRTVAAKEGTDRLRGALAAREVDAVTFTSSSTVHGFMALLAPEERPRLLAGVVRAAIGPITAATLAEYGFPATVVAEAYTAAGLAAALVAHFRHPDPRR